MCECVTDGDIVQLGAVAGMGDVAGFQQFGDRFDAVCALAVCDPEHHQVCGIGSVGSAPAHLWRIHLNGKTDHCAAFILQVCEGGTISSSESAIGWSTVMSPWCIFTVPSLWTEGLQSNARAPQFSSPPGLTPPHENSPLEEGGSRKEGQGAAAAANEAAVKAAVKVTTEEEAKETEEEAKEVTSAKEAKEEAAAKEAEEAAAAQDQCLHQAEFWPSY